MEENEQTLYEVGCLISPLVPQEKVADEVALLRGAIEAAGGTLIEEGSYRMRSLAYPVLHISGGRRAEYDQAYFGAVKFRCAPEKVATIRASIMRIEHIMRFLMTVAPVRMHYATKGPVRERSTATAEKSTGLVDEGAIDKEIESLLTAAS